MGGLILGIVFFSRVSEGDELKGGNEAKHRTILQEKPTQTFISEVCVLLEK